jgi:hypothetical protein
MNGNNRIINAIKEYEKRGFNKGTNRQGAFYLRDLQAVVEMGKDENGETRLHETLMYAMKGAFVLGYRTAKREAKGQKANDKKEETRQPANSKPLSFEKMLFAFETWLNLLRAKAEKLGDCRRFNAEFMEAYPEIESEQAPFVLMFDAFVGAIDLVTLFESEEFNNALKNAAENQLEGKPKHDS